MNEMDDIDNPQMVMLACVGSSKRRQEAVPFTICPAVYA